MKLQNLDLAINYHFANVIIFRLLLRASLEQLSHNFNIPEFGGRNQRRPLGSIAGIDFMAKFEQIESDLMLLLFYRVVKWSLPFFI